ncbi:MAG: exosortase-associated EpsI family protein [Candidatus Acidiferrales bacterium]
MARRQSLSSFPLQIASWRGGALPLTPAELHVLGPGDFLLREYRNLNLHEPVNLYIAYFPFAAHRRHHTFSERLPPGRGLDAARFRSVAHS